uniref:Uncharacterized protein n=1 Tax=Aureoumbra lagunensis TaxID=44058 RepID=A0A7S3JS11_9STRA|mmetsp:Transcript_7378/g.10255  ORF Transcript_7378/g.10255 Transcript_7378/m.10255 type:complete len:322 (+) Transcript_7378:90-1055(+)
MEEEFRLVLEKAVGDERGGLAENLVKAVTPALIARENIVGKLWAIIIVEDIKKIIENSQTPGVLNALAELALPQCPPLIAQELSALDMIVQLINHCSAPGMPTHKASSERRVLISCWRLIAALSTHPITKHLLTKGLDVLARQALELRTDDEILLHVSTFCSNTASDHLELALTLCDARIPRLLARLICEVQVAAEVKEHIVVAANSFAKSCNPDFTHQEDIFLRFPDALAALASSSQSRAATEGIWALHCLVTKGGMQLARKLAHNAPSVLTALEPHAQAYAAADKTQASHLTLAQRVAKLTLDDIRQEGEASNSSSSTT